MARLKILAVINSLEVGGAESLLTQFTITAKKKFNKRLDILTLYNNNNNGYVNLLRNEGIEVQKIKMKRKYAISIIWKIANIIKRGNYKIVFVQLFPATLYIALVSFLLPKIKLIARETSIYTRRRKYRLLKVLDRFIYSRFVKVICVNKKVERELVKWIPTVKGKTVVVSKGIIIPPLKKELPKKYDIIAVGRLIEAKGFNILLESLANTRLKRLVKQVIIAGDGPLAHLLRSKAKTLNISNYVSFLGERTDIDELLQSSKLFVLSSKWEGTPSALLEAMATGLPVISTSVGGIPEIVDDGIDGILVPPENPESLANAIEKVLTDEKLAKRLGQNARQKIEKKYSIEQYTEKMLEIFEILVGD